MARRMLARLVPAGYAAVPLSAGFAFETDGLIFRQDGREVRAQPLSPDSETP